MRDKPKLGQLLVHAGAINSAQLSAALADQQQWGGALGTTLVKMGFVDEETLVRTLARQLKLPVAWLRGKRINPEVLDILPHELVYKHRCLPLSVEEEAGAQILYLAMEDPCDLGVVDDVSFRTGMKVRPVLVAPSELEDAIRAYHLRLERVAAEVEGEEGDPSDGAPPELLRLGESPPPPDDAGTRGVQGSAILRALTQLLIEKGVLTREELVERLAAAQDDGDAV